MAQAGGGAGAQEARRSRAVAPAEKSAGPTEEGSPICSVALCPFCAAVTAFGDARPDLVEHLLVAGREMLLAIRALIDARLEGTGERPAKLERLKIE
jgi:hypothetical protein